MLEFGVRNLVDPTAPPALRMALESSAVRHAHLCPRQVLGARMAIAAGESLGLTLPQAPNQKLLLAIVESYGCFADGVAAAANCHVGRRTMRIEDQGKMAATFVDVSTGKSVRVRPRGNIREIALTHALDAADRWTGYVLGYQRMATPALLAIEEVRLGTPIERIVSSEAARALCHNCDEQIFNEREICVGRRTLCRECAGGGYLLRD